LTVGHNALRSVFSIRSALDRLRKVGSVKVNPDASRIIAKKALVAAVKKCDILFCAATSFSFGLAAITSRSIRSCNRQSLQVLLVDTGQFDDRQEVVALLADVNGGNGP
jgi:hypothetical protein